MIKKSFKTTALIATAISLTACQNLYERNEGVTNFAGNAQAVNRANQTADPWAKHAHDRELTHDSQRLGDAVQRYKENSAESETGITAPTTN